MTFVDYGQYRSVYPQEIAALPGEFQVTAEQLKLMEATGTQYTGVVIFLVNSEGRIYTINEVDKKDSLQNVKGVPAERSKIGEGPYQTTLRALLEEVGAEQSDFPYFFYPSQPHLGSEVIPYGSKKALIHYIAVAYMGDKPWFQSRNEVSGQGFEIPSGFQPEEFRFPSIVRKLQEADISEMITTDTFAQWKPVFSNLPADFDPDTYVRQWSQVPDLHRE